MMSKFKFYGIAFLILIVSIFVFKPSPPQKESKTNIEEKKTTEVEQEEVIKKKKKTTKPDGTIIEEEITKNKKKKENTSEKKTTTIVVKENPVPNLFYGYSSSFSRDNKIEYHNAVVNYRVRDNIQIHGGLRFNSNFKYDGYEVGVLIGHKWFN